MSAEQEVHEEQNPIELLQAQVDDLCVNLALALEANRSLGQSMAEVQQNITRIYTQLTGVSRLQQQVDGIDRAIAEALATGRLGNPNR